MRTIRRFINGLIIGTIFGSLIALLFAPEKGSELRAKVLSRIQEISSQFKQAADQRKAELEEEITQYLKPK